MESTLGLVFLLALIAMILAPMLSRTEAGAWVSFGITLIIAYIVWRIAGVLADGLMWWQDTQVTLPSIAIAAAAGLLAIGWTRSTESNKSDA